MNWTDFGHSYRKESTNIWLLAETDRPTFAVGLLTINNFTGVTVKRLKTHRSGLSLKGEQHVQLKRVVANFGVKVLHFIHQ